MDLNIQTVNIKLRENFIMASKRIFKGNSLIFNGMNLGPECAKVVAKIMNIYTTPEDNKSKKLTKAIPQPCSKVNLGNNLFGSENIKSLIRVCLTHPRLIYLNLQNNDMDDQTMSYLFRNLQKNITIIHLDIGNNKTQRRNRIRKKSAVALKGLLKNNKSLQILNLQNLGITYPFFELIIEGVSHSELISLNLSQNDINDECILLLNQKYSNIKYKLQELILNDVPIVGKSALKRDKHQMDIEINLANFIHGSNIRKLYLTKTNLQVDGINEIIEGATFSSRQLILR